MLLENDAVEQAEMKKAVHKWSEIVELNQLLQHRPQDLSGGQKQRVSMAGVLINQSKILLLMNLWLILTLERDKKQ